MAEFRPGGTTARFRRQASADRTRCFLISDNPTSSPPLHRRGLDSALGLEQLGKLAHPLISRSGNLEGRRPKERGGAFALQNEIIGSISFEQSAPVVSRRQRELSEMSTGPYAGRETGSAIVWTKLDGRERSLPSFAPHSSMVPQIRETWSRSSIFSAADLRWRSRPAGSEWPCSRNVWRRKSRACGRFGDVAGAGQAQLQGRFRRSRLCRDTCLGISRSKVSMCHFISSRRRQTCRCSPKCCSWLRTFAWGSGWPSGADLPEWQHRHFERCPVHRRHRLLRVSSGWYRRKPRWQTGTPGVLPDARHCTVSLRLQTPEGRTAESKLVDVRQLSSLTGEQLAVLSRLAAKAEMARRPTHGDRSGRGDGGD